jgi:hypothetical protein
MVLPSGVDDLDALGAMSRSQFLNRAACRINAHECPAPRLRATSKKQSVEPNQRPRWTSFDTPSWSTAFITVERLDQTAR